MSDVELEIEVQDIRLNYHRTMSPTNQYPEEDHDLSNFQQSQMPQKFLLFEFISDSEKLIAIKTPKLSAKAREIYHETCIKTKKIYQ